MLARDILKQKGSNVWCIQSHQKIGEALEILVEKKIGVLVVLNKKEAIEGILSERDIMRVCFEHRRTFDQISVKKAMTQRVVTVHLDDPIEYLMEKITQNRVRHLPVIEDGKLAGLVSIGDVVKAQLTETMDKNKHLMNYMFYQ